MVEHSAVNRVVVGSSPTRGVKCQERQLGKARKHQCLRVFIIKKKQPHWRHYRAHGLKTSM